ncbi:MAG: hypothetical protein JSW66_06945 [Phycisphaerales bacterium]|nr:MAG: hypothetical protein JSW66_06945 [Phycisphaerales bacterium]
MERRVFLQAMGTCFAVPAAVNRLMVYHPDGQSEGGTIINPNSIRLNVKLVFGACIHSGMWEGPCRWDTPQTPEEERRGLRARFNQAVEDSQKRLNHVNLLEPVYYEYDEDIDRSIGQDLYAQLQEDNETVDLYLIHANVFGQYFNGIIGRRFRKPMAMIGGLINTEAAAYLRSIGVEGYAPGDYEEMNRLMSILRARKVFRQTGILYATDRGRRLKRNVSCISDFEDLRERFGIKTKIIAYKEFGDELTRVRDDDGLIQQAEQIAEQLIREAQRCDIDRTYVISDVQFHMTVKRLLSKFNCNSFTIECREFCASRLADQWKTCPCLNHSMMKSEGFASSCEGDINCLLSMQMLQSLANKAAYMGNLQRDGDDPKLIRLGHEVPAVKMAGYEEADLPYELRNFIVSGWGTKMQIELDTLEEKTVTFARLDPLAKRMLVSKGEVVGCRGFREPGCRLVAVLNVPDPTELLKRRADYGFHFSMVYGDCSQELIELAELLNIDIETHNI